MGIVMMREWEEGHLFHFRLFIRGTDKTKKEQKDTLPLEVFLSSINIIHSTEKDVCSMQCFRRFCQRVMWQVMW